MVLTVSDITCVMNVYWTAYVLICLLQTLPTLTCVRLWTILIRRTNSCVHEVETYCIYYSAQLTSLNKKRQSTDTVFSHAELLRNIPPSLDKLDTSRTVERGDVYFSLYQKGRGTDTCSLVTGAVLALRTKSLNISDLRKTLSSRK